MRKLYAVVALALLLAVSGANTVSAQAHHHPIYLFGAWPWPTTTTPGAYLKGIMALDNTGATPQLTTLTVPGYMPGHVMMDTDNRGVVFAVRGTSAISSLMNPMRSGLFRYDPRTTQVTTIYSHSNGALAYHGFHHGVTDYNGDYVTAVYNYDSGRGLAQYELWKVNSSGTCSTVLTSLSAGLSHSWAIHGHMRINIDTGKLLINDLYRVSTPSYATHYKIYELDLDRGVLTTWNQAPTDAGWQGWNSLPQSHANGWIEGPYNSTVFQLKPGTGGRTTLANLTVPGTLGAYTQGNFDLQTAAAPRQVWVTYHYSNPQLTYLYYMDATNWTVTSMTVAPFRAYNYGGVEFYRGRHTQTVLTGQRRWQLRLSAPMYAGMRYVAVAGVSGVRPGVKLPDGRCIRLNLDPILQGTLNNWIPSIWNSGPGVLDAQGEAQGTINLSTLGNLNMPLWIAWVVLHPSAPGGVAYIPDTYVMRI